MKATLFILRLLLTLWIAAHAALALAMGETSAGRVLDVDKDRLLPKLTQSKGRIILQVTSRDASCGYCVRAIPRFEELAKNNPDAGRYWRITTTPWTASFGEPVMMKHRLEGVPAVLVFEDGQLVNYVPGDLDAATLQTKVLSEKNGEQVPKDGLDIADITVSDLIQMLDRQETFVVLFTMSDSQQCPHCAAGEKTMETAWNEAKGLYRGMLVKRVSFASLQEAQDTGVLRNLKLEGLPAMVCFTRRFASLGTVVADGGRFIGNAGPGPGFFNCSSNGFVHIDHKKQYTRLQYPKK
jgi:thiol-disulfide isomerase/thioredoxin